jgi:hypothetical protein
MAADEVDRDFPEQREILDGIPIPHPAVIFLEGDVENQCRLFSICQCRRIAVARISG